ncbi:unnamed protein product, partial [Rotaria sp. Silwood2]
LPEAPIDSHCARNGVTVAGGHRSGDASNQLYLPLGLFVDDDQTIFIADFGNDRIVQWNVGAESGQVIVGGHGRGNDWINWIGQSMRLLTKKQIVLSLAMQITDESSDGLVEVTPQVEKQY